MKIFGQGGFSAIAVIIAIVVLGAIGTVGWTVHKKNTNTANFNESELQVSDIWVDYKSEAHPITFSYPSNWEVLTSDGATGTNLDAVEATTFTYYVQEPQTSMELRFGAIAKTLSEVTGWRDSIYAKPDFYSIAEIANPSTEKTNFDFQGHKAIRFETTGITAFPPDNAPEDIKKANPKKPVYVTEIYIENDGMVYSVNYGGHVSLENSGPFLKVYETFKIL